MSTQLKSKIVLFNKVYSRYVGKENSLIVGGVRLNLGLPVAQGSIDIVNLKDISKVTIGLSHEVGIYSHSDFCICQPTLSNPKIHSLYYLLSAYEMFSKGLIVKDIYLSNYVLPESPKDITEAQKGIYTEEFLSKYPNLRYVEGSYSFTLSDTEGGGVPKNFYSSSGALAGVHWYAFLQALTSVELEYSHPEFNLKDALKLSIFELRKEVPYFKIKSVADLQKVESFLNTLYKWS